MDRNLVIEDDGNSSSLEGGEQELVKGVAMLRHSTKMQVLVSLLKVSIAESEQHNPALALIKTITSRRYISPEFYDLMDTMCVCP
jgi:hypothetical protein